MPPLSPFYNKHIQLPFLDKMANFVSPLHVGLNACETAWHLPHASQESLTFVKLNFINCAATTITSMCVPLLSSSVSIQTSVYLRLTPCHSTKHLNVHDVCPGSPLSGCAQVTTCTASHSLPYWAKASLASHSLPYWARASLACCLII